MSQAKAERKKLFYSIIYPLIFVLILWLVKGFELQNDLDFGKYGILPRSLEGLKGIFLAPFIHANFEHLINNSVPLLLLGTALFYFYRILAFRIFLLSALLSSLYTWISARYNYHIGASGVVYALFAFLLVSGFIRKHLQLIAISFLVAFFYGSLVWGILPWDHKISWEGHFWGFMVGIILAIYYRKKGPQRKIYQWEDEEDEEDEDENGFWNQDQDYWNSNSSEDVNEWKYWLKK